AIELGIPRRVHHAHATRAQLVANDVATERAVRLELDGGQGPRARAILCRQCAVRRHAARWYPIARAARYAVVPRMALQDAHALVIGIAAYQHIPSLAQVQDAKDVAAALADPACCGYPPGAVQTLLDGAAT